LKNHDASWDDLDGLVVFHGPGSFTGLRIGITVMNTIAYAQSIPIVGVSGDDWAEQGMKLLHSGQGQEIVLPEYGADAHITKPRK
jgi:tRNA threonylcarbamoyladenosine biosynthesis protein TsaB